MSELPTLEQLGQTRLFYTNLVPDPDAAAEAYCDYSGPSSDHPFHIWAALVIQGDCQWVIGGPLPPDQTQGEQLALQNTVSWLRQQGIREGVIYSDSPLCFPAVDASPYQLEPVSGEHPCHYVAHLSANLLRKENSIKYRVPPPALETPLPKTEKPYVFYAISASHKSPKSAAWGAVMVRRDGHTLEGSGPLVKGNHDLARQAVMDWVKKRTPHGASLISAMNEEVKGAPLPSPFQLLPLTSIQRHQFAHLPPAQKARKLAKQARKAARQSLMLGKVL